MYESLTEIFLEIMNYLSSYLLSNIPIFVSLFLALYQLLLRIFMLGRFIYSNPSYLPLFLLSPSDTIGNNKRQQKHITIITIIASMIKFGLLHFIVLVTQGLNINRQGKWTRHHCWCPQDNLGLCLSVYLSLYGYGLLTLLVCFLECYTDALRMM